MTHAHGGGWNRGMRIGQKRPFLPDEVKMIRHAMKARGISKRDVAMFEVGISVVLRASDLLNLKVGDVLDSNGVVETFEVRQKKTGRGVKVSLSKRAREALTDYIASLPGVNHRHYLWLNGTQKISRSTYARLIKQWAALAHLDPKHYATHSMRRTTPAHVYAKTKDIAAARHLLGHASVAATATYLNVDTDAAIETKRKYEL